VKLAITVTSEALIRALKRVRADLLDRSTDLPRTKHNRTGEKPFARPKRR
jgi:hypothetical protein